MNPVSEFQFLQLRSLDDEPMFFAMMGRFFASAGVRRACGGYPLNDGPLYLWFLAQRTSDPRVLGFISIEHKAKHIQIRDGYVRPEVRGQGLFRELRSRVFEHIATQDLPAFVRIPSASIPYFSRHGFAVRAARGSWVTMEKVPTCQRVTT